ncbi:MAG: hypothetical protein M3Y74_16415 [Chloroflexota bacterium]|nr:hypothetical protein [Chloroflexota bacterium]
MSLTLRVRPVHLALCALLFLSFLPPALGVGAAHAASSGPTAPAATPTATPRATTSPLSPTAPPTATASLSPTMTATVMASVTTLTPSTVRTGGGSVTPRATAPAVSTRGGGPAQTPTSVSTRPVTRSLTPSSTMGGTDIPTHGVPLYYPWVAPSTTHASSVAPFASVYDSLGWNSTLTALPQGRRGPAAATGLDGNVYVFGCAPRL